MEDEKKNLQMMESCSNYNKWIADTLKPYVSGTTCEIGCGTGSVAKYFFNDRYYGVDIDEAHVKHCQKIFKHPENFFYCDVEKKLPAFFRHRFDTVIMCNVLEHCYNDRFAVDNAWRMLKKGGRLVVLVPAHKNLFGEIDVSDGHYRRYSLKMLMDLFGDRFIVEHYNEMNMAGSLGWYVTGKVFPTKVHKEEDLGLFDDLVPVFRWVENRIKIPFGLSLFIVGEKK